MKLFLSTEIPFLPTYLMHEEIKRTTQRERETDRQYFRNNGAFCIL
jgi:hypothetical protein